MLTRTSSVSLLVPIMASNIKMSSSEKDVTHQHLWCLHQLPSMSMIRNQPMFIITGIYLKLQLFLKKNRIWLVQMKSLHMTLPLPYDS